MCVMLDFAFTLTTISAEQALLRLVKTSDFFSSLFDNGDSMLGSLYVVLLPPAVLMFDSFL